MKNNFVHICFIIDKSGSMHGSEKDIIGGFKSVIEEQTKNPDITCAVSLYQFDNAVYKSYIGKPVNEIEHDIEYIPSGCTSMNDAIGQSVTEIGKWLADMPEEGRPEKNIIVIMTDGEENSSKEYTIDKIKAMIKEQQEKYNWTFIYLGADISDASYANDLNFGARCFTSKSSGAYAKVFGTINTCLYNYSKSASSNKAADLDLELSNAYSKITDEYVNAGNNVKNL